MQKLHEDAGQLREFEDLLTLDDLGFHDVHIHRVLQQRL